MDERTSAHLTSSLLTPFPGTGGPALELHADCRRHASGMEVLFFLEGPLTGLRIPEASAAPRFENGLWQHTCFELFVGRPGETAYREFNFAPSGHWAAYAFSDYRERMDWQPASSPTLSTRQAPDQLLMKIELPAALLPEGPLDLGLTAVLESSDGSLSYWALRHAGERPDFHLRESFLLPLAPAHRP